MGAGIAGLAGLAGFAELAGIAGFVVVVESHVSGARRGAPGFVGFAAVELASGAEVPSEVEALMPGLGLELFMRTGLAALAGLIRDQRPWAVAGVVRRLRKAADWLRAEWSLRASLLLRAGSWRVV